MSAPPVFPRHVTVPVTVAVLVTVVTEGVVTVPVIHCRPCLTLHCGGVGVSQTVASTELSPARSKLISSDFRILLTSLQPPSETMKPDLVRVELRISESTQIQSYFYKDNFPEHS